MPSNTTLKFHYDNVDLLLDDYKEYMMKFQDQKTKPVEQYILDIKDVWMSVDQTMCLFPNGLKQHEMIESCFYLPQKRKLLENKDKEVQEQECHIQAKTIKSKLNNVVRMLKFFQDRSIFAGFNRNELHASQQFLRELRTGLKDLIRQRGTQMKEYKSKIYLSPSFFKMYGSSKHVAEITTFLESLSKKPESTQIRMHHANPMLYKCSARIQFD